MGTRSLEGGGRWKEGPENQGIKRENTGIIQPNEHH